MNITKQKLKEMKEYYTPCSRVELIERNNSNLPPLGSKGEVFFVDNTGDIIVLWDAYGSSTLSLNDGFIKE